MNVDEEEQQKKNAKSALFQGSGFKLGDSEGPSVHVRGKPQETTAEKVLCYGRLAVTFTCGQTNSGCVIEGGYGGSFTVAVL